MRRGHGHNASMTPHFANMTPHFAESAGKVAKPHNGFGARWPVCGGLVVDFPPFNTLSSCGKEPRRGLASPACVRAVTARALPSCVAARCTAHLLRACAVRRILQPHHLLLTCDRDPPVLSHRTAVVPLHNDGDHGPCRLRAALVTFLMASQARVRQPAALPACSVPAACASPCAVRARVCAAWLPSVLAPRACSRALLTAHSSVRTSQDRPHAGRGCGSRPSWPSVC